MTPKPYSPDMEREIARYRDSLPARLELDALSRLLEGFELSDLSCLDVGLSSPVMSYALRELGGHWTTLADTPETAERFAAALAEPVESRTPDGDLPFGEKQFDLMVLGLGQLTGIRDELEVLRDCHRILKPTGSLVLSLEHAKPWAMANLIKRMAIPSQTPGYPRRGYTERELFEIIKTGFDVFSLRTYCRFWVTLVRLWEQARFRSRTPGTAARDSIRRRAGLLYRLAHQLDALLFWTRGYCLLVHARRHVWRDRSAPVLRDGRRISEAVLSRSS